MTVEPKTLQPRSPNAQTPVAADSTLVTIKSGSSAVPPLFCVHAEAGDVSLYHALASYLAPDQPVLGLCAPRAGEESLERLAERHVHEIDRAQAEGPYLILGECTGGALAFEIAQQLHAAGRRVALLGLVDSFPPGLPHLHRRMPVMLYRTIHRARIIGFHLGNLARLDMRGKLDYAAAKARRAAIAAKAKAQDLRGRSAPDSPSPRSTFRRSFAAYRPVSYAGSMVLFRAAQMPLGAGVTADLGWADLADDVQIETISGYFTTPISEPEVKTLADRLAGHLARAGGAV
jgi:thioesterase domain-containing protein